MYNRNYVEMMKREVKEMVKAGKPVGIAFPVELEQDEDIYYIYFDEVNKEYWAEYIPVELASLAMTQLNMVLNEKISLFWYEKREQADSDEITCLRYKDYPIVCWIDNSYENCYKEFLAPFMYTTLEC